MTQTIKLKRGTTTPTTSNIVSGEVAIDTSAQKLYINDAGTIKEIGGGGGISNVVEDTTPQLGGNLDLNGNNITGSGNISATDLTLSGDLTVQGTTTTLNTATLQVEDNNIVLNYSTGDSSASANGAGITIQDAVNSTTDATLLWDATNDEWDFSHNVTAPNLNVSNWDTAFSWGNHASAGYLTSYTETDPVFSASAASGITSTNITNWNTAYGWGDHASAGYATSFNSLSAKDSGTGNYRTTGYLQSGSSGSGMVSLTTNDGAGNANVTFNDAGNTPDAAGYNRGRITVNVDSTSSASMTLMVGSGGNTPNNGFVITESGVSTSGFVAASGGNSGNWNTAYGWGNHATAGYLTSITGQSIENLSDVNTMTPTDGQVLTWDNANSRWDAADASGGGLTQAKSTAITLIFG